VIQFTIGAKIGGQLLAEDGRNLGNHLIFGRPALTDFAVGASGSWLTLH
jgi:hypothetical protein